MTIMLHRIYDTSPAQGYRVLVDRLWPRGITKQQAGLNEWCKTLAPSPPLRTWFGHKPERWTEFSKRYRKELEAHGTTEGEALLKRAGKSPLVLLYGAKDAEHTHARVLQRFLEELPKKVAKKIKYIKHIPQNQRQTYSGGGSV